MQRKSERIEGKAVVRMSININYYEQGYIVRKFHASDFPFHGRLETELGMKSHIAPYVLVAVRTKMTWEQVLLSRGDLCEGSLQSSNILHPSWELLVAFSRFREDFITVSFFLFRLFYWIKDLGSIALTFSVVLLLLEAFSGSSLFILGLKSNSQVLALLHLLKGWVVLISWWWSFILRFKNFSSPFLKVLDSW